MKLGIMQPYFFPYIGYWQLMNAVDQYVIYDDVNFIKGGWINRNRILINDEIKYFNLPLMGSSSFKKICKIGVNIDERVINKNIRTLENAYGKAKYYREVMPILIDILKNKNNNLADNLTYGIKKIAKLLNIKTVFFRSSEMTVPSDLHGKDRVIYLCKRLGASEYYNAIGGRKLYNFEEFKQNDIKLKFLRTDDITYLQYGKERQKNLSIIDVLMFNDIECIKNYLEKYVLE